MAKSLLTARAWRSQIHAKVTDMTRAATAVEAAAVDARASMRDVHCEMATVSKKVDALKVMKGLPKEALALITELERAQSRAKQAARDATRALAVAAEKMPNKVCDVRACAAALSTSAHMLASGAGAAATNAVEENVQGMRRQYGLEAYGSWGLEESHDGEVAARCVAQQFM